MKGQPPGIEVRLGDARKRRLELKKRLEKLRASGGRISRDEGILLTSRGDWEILATKLLQQAAPSKNEDKVFAGILTRGDEKEAIRMTAGFHPRLGDLSSLLSPLPVFFTHEERRLLFPLFELILWNPSGDTMHFYGREDFAKIRGRTDLIGATKAFEIAGDAAGLTAFEKIGKISASLKKPDLIRYDYVAGYTGVASILLKGKFPAHREMRERGVHLGIVGTDREGSLSLGTLFSGRTDFKKTALDHRRHFFRFKNEKLGIPVTVDVSGDKTLRDVQVIASVWKNAGSLCLGRSLFESLYRALKNSPRISASSIADQDRIYGRSQGRMIGTVKRSLIASFLEFYAVPERGQEGSWKLSDGTRDRDIFHDPDQTIDHQREELLTYLRGLEIGARLILSYSPPWPSLSFSLPRPFIAFQRTDKNRFSVHQTLPRLLPGKPGEPIYQYGTSRLPTSIKERLIF